MKRHALRGLVMLGLIALVTSVASAQTTTDTVEVRNRKDGTTKTFNGQFKVGPGGFQVFSGEKLEKASEAFAPDDIVKVIMGNMPGVDANAFNGFKTKEDKKTTKDYTDAIAGYKDLTKKATTDRGRRYLEYKVASVNQKIVDELDMEKGWKEKADEAISAWQGFIGNYTEAGKFGWEVWPAVRSVTRLQIERGKYDDAASAWGNLRKSVDLPADAKLEAGLQEVDLKIRSKSYATAATAAAPAGELDKVAVGSRKERLAIYDLAAKAGTSGKLTEGVEAIKAAMEKTKDTAVHATGFAMMGELYLAAGKPRDAMWMFLWVETVVNQDKDEVFKAISRLAEMFESQMMDEEQAKKYREKIKRFRGTF